MAQTTLQFISQVKLGELRRQRALLLDAYDRIGLEATVGSEVDGLRVLYHGLRGVRVAGKPMHPDLGNLEFVLNGADPSAETVAFWRGRLEAEARAGRLRADIVYLFGALLGEWGDDATPAGFREERRQAHETLRQQARTPSPETDHRPLFDEVFAGLRDRLPQAADRIAEAIDRSIQHGSYAVGGLADVAQNIYEPAAIRAEARRFLNDHVLQSQFDDALRVVTRDPREWAWPVGGVTTRALWTRNKWRLYPDLSLVQLSVLNSFGRFWAWAVEVAYSDAATRLDRLARLQKLTELNAPEVIVENEKRMLRQVEESIDLGWYEPADPWDETPTVPASVEDFTHGVASRRATAQMELRLPHAGGYYEGYGANRVVHLVHAEVRTLRAAFPGTPLYVVKFDIANYFATIPHDVLIEMLGRLGLTEDGLAAVRRFLAVPHRVDGQVVPAVRGVPMNQHLSHWLAEYLLRLMERHIHQSVRVRIIRQTDDVCLLAPDATQIAAAWEAAQRFLKACGLDVNAEKGGALAIGADLPPGLPAGGPRWGLLELTVAGEWGVHEEALQTFLSDTQKHIAARPALLGRVTLYNAHLRFLTTALGLALDLGDVHRAAVGVALRRFEAEAFGPGVSVVAGLRAGIAERYLNGTGLGHLPESWMYWPITAGGLSLRSALVLEGQYREGLEARRKERVEAPAERPADWQAGDTDWLAFYEDQLAEVTPAKPKESKVMRTLVEDFIARGREISGGKQESLSDYWRWVLCLYGPEILDKFGTFRFLLTDLVPLQLIHEQLLNDSSLDGHPWDSG